MPIFATELVTPLSVINLSRSGERIGSLIRWQPTKSADVAICIGKPVPSPTPMKNGEQINKITNNETEKIKITKSVRKNGGGKPIIYNNNGYSENGSAHDVLLQLLPLLLSFIIFMMNCPATHRVVFYLYSIKQKHEQNIQIRSNTNARKRRNTSFIGDSVSYIRDAQSRKE